MSEYPIKPIKKILKKHHGGEVSGEALIYLRDILLDFTELIVKQAVQEFLLMNQRRLKNGLSPLKRLDRTSFILAKERIFKQFANEQNGEVGNRNDILLCRDGAKNGKDR